MGKQLAAVLILVYVAGCFTLNEAVSDACTHGNCIHGWYSKYNGAQKFTFFAWMIGYPLAIAGAASGIRRLTGETARNEERKSTASANRAQAARVSRAQKFTHLQSANSRKEWHCSECRSGFPKGTRYYYDTARDGSYQIRIRYCAACRQRGIAQGKETP